MRYKKSAIMVLMALLLTFAVAACGQNTENAVNDGIDKPMEENMDKSGDEAMEDKGDDSMDNNNDGDGDTMEESDSDDDSMTDDDESDEMVMLELTLDELAKFNGKDGQPAYIAVDGVIYDVSDVGAWKSGTHQGFEAGKDVTDQINEISPHGVRVLENLKAVGKLTGK